MLRAKPLKYFFDFLKIFLELKKVHLYFWLKYKVKQGSKYIKGGKARPIRQKDKLLSWSAFDIKETAFGKLFSRRSID